MSTKLTAKEAKTQCSVGRMAYDMLVSIHPTWMQNVWPTLTRQWYLSGCMVSGNEKHIKELRDMIESF